MADILNFPRIDIGRPRLTVIDGGVSLVELECDEFAKRAIAKAAENLASAQLDLAADASLAIDGYGGISDRIAEETIVSVAIGLIALIDAKGCRTADRPLREQLQAAIDMREARHG